MLDVLYQLSPITHRSTKKRVVRRREDNKRPRAKNHFGEFFYWSEAPSTLRPGKFAIFPPWNIRFFVFLSGVTLVLKHDTITGSAVTLCCHSDRRHHPVSHASVHYNSTLTQCPKISSHKSPFHQRHFHVSSISSLVPCTTTRTRKKCSHRKKPTMDLVYLPCRP
jgi:hypothetical protein